jgi:O-antigen/teichoic acid export membrane protein
MEQKSNLKANIVYNMLYQLLLIITPLITSPYISRVLGTDGVGVFSYTYSLASCFAMVGMLGIANYGNRSIATVQSDRERRSDVFWNVFSIQAIFSVATIIAYLLYVCLFVASEFRIAMFIQTFTVACSLFDINWYFFGVEKFKLTVTRNSIIKLLNIVLIFTLVKNKTDVNLYVGIIVISLCLSNIILWPFLKNEVYFVKPSLKEMHKHIKPVMVLFIPIIAITLYNRMDKVMIGMFSTMDEAGLYENTEKIINIPKSLITALGTVMLPRMANLYATGKSDSASSYIDRTMEFTCFSSVAMAFGIAGIANEFAPWFFGQEFSGVSVLLIGIAPTIVFVSWANVIRTQYLIPLEKDRIYVVSVWIGAIVNMILNSLLISSFGALGAVIGTVMAEFSVAFYQSFKVRRELPIARYVKMAIPYIISGIIMYAVVRLVSKISGGMITLVVEIISGTIVYLGVAGVLFLKKNNLFIMGLNKK